jgi:dihydropteroate synthase
VSTAFPPRRSYRVPLPRGAALALGPRPLVMGVLNLTPDSFAASEPLVGPGGVDVARATSLALQMEADGADLVDVGGESTRPGASPVAADEELARVMPVIRALASRLRIPLSIDTYKADVAYRALSEGAVIVNDISGLQYEPHLAQAVAATGAALVLMHTRGRPGEMYAQARYADVAAEVAAELGRSIDVARAAGIDTDRLIVDPGIGFAKLAAHSYGVLARLPEIAAAVDRPVLVGPSRKSFLVDAVGERPPVDRDWGTAAAVTAAILAGAHIVRVHAVAEMVQVVRVAETLRAQGRASEGRVSVTP